MTTNPTRPTRSPPDPVRLVAIVCLTVVVVAAIAGLTVVAVMTDRDLWPAEVLTAGVAVMVAVLGGLSLRHRWRLSRNGNGDG